MLYFALKLQNQLNHPFFSSDVATNYYKIPYQYSFDHVTVYLITA